MTDWKLACDTLAGADPDLAQLFTRYPGERLVANPDGFQVLCNAIVGQQISVKAAASIWQRLVVGLGALTPQTVATAAPEFLRECGLSRRKVEYFQAIAAANLTAIDELDDAAAISRLCELRGIGRWTAEMYLIFHLERPDVLPLDDVALVRAAQQHFGFVGDPIRALRERGETWRPYRTVATWYLWRILDPVAISY